MAMIPNKDDHEVVQEQRHDFRMFLVDRVTTVLMLAVKAVIALGLTYCLVLIVEALAGKETTATVAIGVEANTNIFIEFLAKFALGYKWAWVMAVVAVIYGLAERELRRRKTAYLQNRIIELEQQLDPNRESSTLTVRGETNPKDKL